MPIKEGMLNIASKGVFYVASHNKSGGGTKKQGIAQDLLDGFIFTHKYLYRLKTI